MASSKQGSEGPAHQLSQSTIQVQAQARRMRACDGTGVAGGLRLRVGTAIQAVPVPATALHRSPYARSQVAVRQRESGLACSPVAQVGQRRGFAVGCEPLGARAFCAHPSATVAWKSRVGTVVGANPLFARFRSKCAFFCSTPSPPFLIHSHDVPVAEQCVHFGA